MRRLYTEKKDNSIIISIDGDIEFDDSFEIDNTIQTTFEEGFNNIILNLKDCHYIDSCGLGAIARNMQITKQKKKNFMLCNLTQDCKEIIMMTMLNKHMHIYNNIEECMERVII